MECGFQGGYVYGNTTRLHPISHIDGQDHRNAKVLYLGIEIEVLLEVLHIGHQHYHIGKIYIIFVQETTDGHLLVHGIRIGTIGAWQVVYSGIDRLGKLTKAYFLIHSNPWVVSHMLVHTC